METECAPQNFIAKDESLRGAYFKEMFFQTSGHPVAVVVQIQRNTPT